MPYRNDKIPQYFSLPLSFTCKEVNLMAVPMNFRYTFFTWLSATTLVSLSLVGLPEVALGQSPVDPLDVEQTDGLNNNFNELRPTQSTGTLSIAGNQQLLDEAEAAIAVQDYDLATEKLLEAREGLNQLSNYYQDLGQMFLGINTQLHQSNREKALETAQLRDLASYQLALVYRTQNQPDMAIPLLMEILRSQQPTRELGQRAYQQLFEIGFVDEPYTGSGSASNSSGE
jgi:tetratricopeptide (TPR) repeat protein